MAVVLTGDELRPPGSAPRPGSVVDSIGPALEALGAQAGATVRVLEPARDDLDALRATVRDALAGSDLVVTVGGVSVGDRDHGLVRSFALGNLPEVLADLYRDRAQWEARDPGLKAVFAQQAEAAHDASPTVSQGARRFARGNPLVSVAALVAALWAVWTSLRPARRPARRPTRRRSRAA